MKVTINGGIYFDTSSIGVEQYLPQYKFFSGPAESFGNYIAVCAHEITADIPDDFDPRPEQVKQLEAQRKELHEKFARAVMEIDRRINSLLALEAA